MGIGIIALIVVIIITLILVNILKFGLKLIGLVLLVLALAGTIYICTQTPNLHKPFSIDTVEYLFKINKDGSVSTTKQITQTVIEEK